MARINFLPPWVETNLQPAFYDLESGTCLQQTARMYDKVNQLVRSVNEQNDTIADYIQQFIDLKDYVEDYFENLDVQEEINNKLDAMVEAGTLQEIIAQYLQSNVTWTFDTVAEMKSATNLAAGSYAQTLGFYEVGDGGGATYLISDSGTADEKAIIAVGDLFATIVTTDVINVKQFGAKGDGETNDTSSISVALDYAKTGDTVVFPTATYLCNVYCTKALHFDFKGSQLISYDNQSILGINGSKSTTGYVLSANLVRGDKEISFLNTGTLELDAGDYILLRDDSVRPGDGLQNINEEVHQIESISGNTITLRDIVRFKKSVATSTANIYKINMLDGITIKNINVYDNNHDATGIFINYCKNVVIENVTADNMNMPAIYLNSSVNIKLDGFEFGEPQTADAGKGYGVLIDHGTNSFTITNGKGDKQRHLIDCSSCFDGKIGNVIATNSQSASFVMAHNSYASDITFDNCTADGGDWYGFEYASQGVENYYDMVAYNFNILNCKVYPTNTTVNSVGCFFQCPVQDSTIDNFTVIGKVRNNNGYGIRLMPINNRILVTNAKITKVNRAVLIESSPVAESDNLYYNRFINVYINDCNFGFRIGNLKEIFIDKIYTDHCNTLLDIGAYDAEKTNALKFFNLTNGIFKSLTNLMIFNSQNYEDATYIVGKINNINLFTSQGNYKVNVVNNSKILDNITALFARCSNPEGIFVPIHQSGGNAVTLAEDFLINGFTLYQTVTIVNYGTSTITLPHSTGIQNSSGSSVALTAGASIKYIWNGVCWHQVA